MIQAIMSAAGDFGNPLRKFKLVFLGEQSGEFVSGFKKSAVCEVHGSLMGRWGNAGSLSVSKLALAADR